MENIVLEIQYLPPIQYVTKFVGYERVFVEKAENYLKGSYRNRCYIAAANGPMRLTIPLLKGKNEQQSIAEVRIANAQSWQIHHWQSIRSAYGSAPFFDHFADELEVFYQKPYEFLFDFNFHLLQWTLEQIGLQTRLHTTQKYQSAYEFPTLDFRNSIFPKKHRQKKDEQFREVLYPQVFMEKNGFLPNLSILDLLFCAGPETILILEECIAGRQDSANEQK